MANRFTDSDKWNDPWYCSLSNEYKLLWNYVCDRCDHAGIWKVNMPLVKFHIGIEEIDKKVFNGRIKELHGEEWFIEKTVLFQQKINSLDELNPMNKCHLSIIKILSKKGILSPYEAPTKPLARGLGIGIGIGKGNKGGVGGFNFDTIWSKYPNKDGRKAAERHFISSVKTEQDYKDIQTALNNYLASETVAKGFIKNGSTWFNNWRDWVVPPKKGKLDGIPDSLKKYAKSI
jgi:hypothetical protein